MTNHAELRQYLAKEGQYEVVKGDKPKPDGLFLAPIAEERPMPKKIPVPVKQIAPKNVKSKVNTNNIRPTQPVKDMVKPPKKEKSLE